MVLSHLRILVTRPAEQNQPLVNLLLQAGALPLCVPTIAVKPLDDISNLLQTLQQISQTDIFIFNSANAVRYAVPLLKEHINSWPPTTTTLAVGPGTQRCLSAAGWQHVIMPQDTFNSEALLQLPELQPPLKKNIMIFCGQHPRPLLANTLIEREAHVQLAICYERFRPDIDTMSLLDQFKQGKVDIIISTSNESLTNLFAACGTQMATLLNTPIVVVSPKMVATLAALGYTKQPIVAQNATDSSIMAALTQWYEEQHHER